MAHSKTIFWALALIEVPPQLRKASWALFYSHCTSELFLKSHASSIGKYRFCITSNGHPPPVAMLATSMGCFRRGSIISVFFFSTMDLLSRLTYMIFEVLYGVYFGTKCFHALSGSI